MKRFSYEARDVAANRVVKATVQAESERAAAKALIAQGFTPLSIKELDDSRGLLGKLSGRITTKDRVVFTRQLATLIGAGLPLTQSLHTVADQTENKRLKAVIEDIVASVEGGRSLSDAFSKHEDVFDSVYRSLISAGEASGTLDESLQRIAEQQEKDAAMMSKIKGALTYPIIVLVVIMAVMAFMLFTVVPQVEKLYDDMHQSLPFLTRVMVNSANFAISFWWLILIIVGIALYFFIQYLKTDAGIKFKDLFKLNVPVFKSLFRKLYMARLARTGQTLLASGVPMLDMLHITASAINNTIIEASIERAAEKVKGGKALSESIKREEYVLPLIPQMISIGEQSGQIDIMMGKAAQVYEDDLDESIKAISTAIEPILMVVLAIVAGVMVSAILFPIYNLVNNVSV